MSTLSVPLSPSLEAFILSMVQSGRAANKVDVVRKALKKMSEDEAVRVVLEAEQEIRDGKALRGDLDVLASMI